MPSIYLYTDVKKRRYTYLFLIIVILVSMTYVILITLLQRLSSMITFDDLNTFNSLYRRPFGPMGSYAFGIFLSLSYF